RSKRDWSSDVCSSDLVKIGMELFYAAGADIVRVVKRRGHKVFLDLKLHDIPNTVKRSMAVLSALDVDMCNLHAGGGIAMMQAARSEERRVGKDWRCVC